MDLFTLQLSRWRLARNRDITVIDTTVKNNTSVFCPTWDMVMSYKLGNLSEEEYTQQYRAKMNASWRDPKERPIWLGTIEAKEPLAIGCMCGYKDPQTGLVKFCHRHLLKDIFEKLCKARGIPFYYYGELTND